MTEDYHIENKGGNEFSDEDIVEKSFIHKAFRHTLLHHLRTQYTHLAKHHFTCPRDTHARTNARTCHHAAKICIMWISFVNP